MDNKKNLALPISIVIAAVIIGGGIYFSRGSSPSPETEDPGNNEEARVAGEVLKVVEGDYILGSPEAPVSFFIYSDLECPACRSFHPAIKQVADEYGKAGKIKIIFRHFPLVSIHQNAIPLARGAECAGKQGGSSKFWGFVDNVVALDTVDPKVASKNLGLNEADFDKCVASNEFDQKINNIAKDGVGLGVNSTPSSFVVAQDGKIYKISGSYSFEELKESLGTLFPN